MRRQGFGREEAPGDEGGLQRESFVLTCSDGLSMRTSLEPRLAEAPRCQRRIPPWSHSCDRSTILEWTRKVTARGSSPRTTGRMASRGVVEAQHVKILEERACAVALDGGAEDVADTERDHLVAMAWCVTENLMQ